MKVLKDILKEIEHIPKCSRSKEYNLYFLIRLFKRG